VVVNVAPVVTQNPANQTVPVGGTATFTAAATGTPTPTVQWQVDTGSGFNNLAGATSTTLNVPNVTPAMNGNKYRAVFTNVAGTATTTAATLTVTGCDTATVTGNVSERDNPSVVAVSFRISVPGQITGCLTGPAGTDFDLYLEYYGGSGWTTVAGSAGLTSTETITYNATALDRYRFVVVAYSGSGTYTLKYGKP
jgi:hypothetical protein